MSYQQTPPVYVASNQPYYTSQPISTTPQGSSGGKKKKIVGFVIGGILVALLITVIGLVISGTFDSGDDNWNKPAPTPSRTGGGGTPTRSTPNVLSIDFGHLNHDRMIMYITNTTGQSLRISRIHAKVRLQGEKIASPTYYSIFMPAHDRATWTFSVDWSDDLKDDISGRSSARVQIDFEADIDGMGTQKITYDKKLPVT